MPTFNVTWEMEIDADTPQEAAMIARNYQRDHAALVGAFALFNESGDVINVDLDDVDQQDPAYQTALDHGWLPTDSDTASEFCQTEGIDPKTGEYTE